MRLFAKTFSKIALIGSIFTAPVIAQDKITVPSKWPSQEMQMGFVWASAQDWAAIDANAGSLSSYYTYRFMDLTWMTEQVAQGAISDMLNEGSARAAHPGVIMQLFYDKPISDAARQDRKDALLRKMNNATQVAQFFNILRNLSNSVNAASGKVPTVVLEPDTWGYILQAKFHLENEAAPADIAGGQTYANVLDFPAKVNYSDLQSAGIDAWYADKLVGYSSDVKGLARAMISMAKQLMPSASIAIPAKTWAVFADGCSGSGKSSRDGSEIVSGQVDVQGVDGIVNWGSKDIQLAAFSYVKFLRDLYGWDDQYNANNWPDLITVQRGGLDAGLVQHGPGQSTPEGPAYPSTDPGAGTSTFFWNQGQMDKWLGWTKAISHGTKLPLIGLNVPVGNGATNANQPFNYQDTFMDWLFGNGTSGNWGTTPLPSDGQVPTWSAENFNKFKEAGFVGLWVGAVGWPAVGTHYGYRADNTSKGGPSGSMNGDGGFAITSFSAKDRSFTGVTVSFDEEAFSSFTGFCDATEATAETKLDGDKPSWVVNDPNTAKADTTNLFTSISGEKNNGEILAANKDKLTSGLLSNNIVLYILDSDGTKKPILPGTALASGEVLGANSAGLGTDANQGFTAEDAAFANQFTDMFLNLDITIPQMAQVKDASAGYDQKVGAMWPLYYDFNIFDNLGQFVASAKGVIGEEDLIKMSTVEGPNLKIALRMKILPFDQSGRHIGTGIYYLRGYFEEVVKSMCTPILFEMDGAGNPMLDASGERIPKDPAEISFNELVNEEACNQINNVDGAFSVYFGARVRNGITITDNFGYTRAP